MRPVKATAARGACADDRAGRQCPTRDRSVGGPRRRRFRRRAARDCRERRQSLVLVDPVAPADRHAGAVLVVSLSLRAVAGNAGHARRRRGRAARRRIFTVRSNAWETLARVTHVVFDKTGTLTKGQLSLASVEPLAGHDRAQCVAIAATLEAGSTHPIAEALTRELATKLQGESAGALHEPCAAAIVAESAIAVCAEGIVAVPGSGVEAMIDGRPHRFGRPEWVAALHGEPMPAIAQAMSADAISVALAHDRGWIAWFAFGDAVRPGAAELVAQLRRMHIGMSQRAGAKAFAQHCPCCSRCCNSPVQRAASGLDSSGASCRAASSTECSPLALFTGSPVDGALVMLAFGIGTLPNLMAAHYVLARTRRLAGVPMARIAAALLVARKRWRCAGRRRRSA